MIDQRDGRTTPTLTMIDVHAHILPGVDDGPATWDEALATLRMAAEDGIGHIVSTSHMVPDSGYDNRRSKLLPLIDELKARLVEEGIPIQVHAGSELYLTPETAKLIAEGEVLTYLDKKRYALVEFPAAEIPNYAEQALFDLQLLGVTPIIAHPERNQGVRRDPGRLLEMVERGALTQVTASSLHAKAFAAMAELLIRQGAVHFIASDTHGVTRRPPLMSRVYPRLSQLVGREGAQRLLWTNPKCVIDGAAVPAEPVRPLQTPPERSRRGVLARLFSRRR